MTTEASEKMELIDEGVVAVRKIGEFTERLPHQVVFDALRVYEEVLEAWYQGKKVVFLDEEQKTFTPLSEVSTVLIKHRDLAKEYFESL